MGTPLQSRFKSKATEWPGVDNITRSAWFDGSADYLSRSSVTGTSRRKWSIFGSFLITDDSARSRYIFECASGTSTQTALLLRGEQDLDFFEYGGGAVQAQVRSNGLIRDAGWYTFLCVCDTANASAALRWRLFVNGVEQSTDRTNPSADYDTSWNGGTSQHIGVQSYSSLANYWGGKLSNILHADNTALTTANVWATDTVGTNGTVYYPKSESDLTALANAGGTASFLLSSDIGDGTDDSDKGNNFTASSMSDSANGSRDTPTSPSPVFSPLHKSAVTVTLSEGGQRAELASGAAWVALSTLVPPTGKYYVEFLANTVNSNAMAIGVCNPFVEQDASPRSSGFLQWEADGDRYLDGSQTATEVSSWSATNVIGLGINMDAKQLLFYDNAGNLDATVAFGANVDGSNGVLVYLATLTGAQNATVKIKSAELTHGLPTGYVTLESLSFPKPPIQGVDVFNPLLYTGNAADNRGITGAGFKPDLIWLKKRNATLAHKLVDSTRGIGKILASDATTAEATETWLDSFDVDGFTIDNSNNANDNTATYVGWLFKANGGTTASDASGDITSTVQASNFFSVVTWTGSASADRDIGHGLGSSNISVFVKNRSDAASWVVSMCGMTSTQYLVLDDTAAIATASDHFKRDDFTETTFRVGDHNNINGSSDNMLAYCFKNTPGVCMAGTYVGNGDADGPIINTGFLGRWIIIKSAASSAGWICLDTVRDTVQPLTAFIYMDTTAAEAATGFTIDGLANGFKIRDTGSSINSAGTVYHFISIADVATGAGIPPILGR